MSPRTMAKTNFSAKPASLSSGTVATMKTALAVRALVTPRKSARSAMVEVPGVATFSSGSAASGAAAGLRKVAICRLAR